LGKKIPEIWFGSTYYTLCSEATRNSHIVSQVPHCDGLYCNHLWLWLEVVLESFKSLVLASSFWDILWRSAFILQNPSHCDGHKCDHLWRFCDSLKVVDPYLPTIYGKVLQKASQNTRHKIVTTDKSGTSLIRLGASDVLQQQYTFCAYVVILYYYSLFYTRKSRASIP
jgi:hypothetical protein